MTKCDQSTNLLQAAIKVTIKVTMVTMIFIKPSKTILTPLKHFIFNAVVWLQVIYKPMVYQIDLSHKHPGCKKVVTMQVECSVSGDGSLQH